MEVTGFNGNRVEYNSSNFTTSSEHPGMEWYCNFTAPSGKFLRNINLKEMRKLLIANSIYYAF